MAHQNLPTDLLRTFVTVADHKSFTKAGELLGRTQPAVSLQIRRLEGLLGCELISTKGRANLLTPQGEEFVRFARQMLCLNDEIIDTRPEPACRGVAPGRAASRLCGRVLSGLADALPSRSSRG